MKRLLLLALPLLVVACQTHKVREPVSVEYRREASPPSGHIAQCSAPARCYDVARDQCAPHAWYPTSFTDYYQGSYSLPFQCMGEDKRPAP